MQNYSRFLSSSSLELINYSPVSLSIRYKFNFYNFLFIHNLRLTFIIWQNKNEGNFSLLPHVIITQSLVSAIFMRRKQPMPLHQIDFLSRVNWVSFVLDHWNLYTFDFCLVILSKPGKKIWNQEFLPAIRSKLDRYFMDF